MGNEKQNWKPTPEPTVSVIKAMDRAIKFAQENIIPSGCNGAYFCRETGKLTDWVMGEPERGNGLIFIHFTDFKYRGTKDEYIEHLEQLVNHLSEKRETTLADKLLAEAHGELIKDDDNYLTRNCEWFRDVDDYLSSRNQTKQGGSDADSN